MGVATIRSAEDALSVPRSESHPHVRLRLAVRGFLALAVLLAVTIVTTSATLLYNAATTLRDEAEANAVTLSELFSASFAEMGEISLANVARTLDATLDPQMIAQARIAAQLVAAAEAAEYDPPRIIRILDGIVAETVLDEFWITDETAFSYLTNVRDERGRLVPFQFDPDPAVQPQASKFYVLLAGDDGDVITQPAQVREIDNEVYKYVGVGGVDKQRIVQVGNGIVFGDQEILTSRYTSERADVSAIIEGILGQQMAAQATMLERFIAAAEAAAWTRDDIEFRLRRITTTTAIDEIRVSDANGVPLYSSLLPPAAGGAGAALVRPAGLDELSEGSRGVVEHPTAPRPSDGALYKYVTVATGEAARRVQVGIPIESASGGNLLYSVYQREADVLVRSGNQDLDALWVVNLDRELAAAARRAEVQTTEGVDAWQLFENRAAAVMDTAIDQGRVVSAVSLSLFSPEDRGIWVASPLINTGGIPIGGLAIAVNLDDIADTVIGETGKTVVIAFVLLALTGFAAAGGTRWLTHPIEVIAEAARQVETGKPPDSEAMQEVMRRTDELGSLARVFSDMTVQVFNREEQLETMVAARTRELQTTNQRLQIAHEALKQDLSMAKVVQEALVREGDAEFERFSVSAKMTPAQEIGGDFVEFMDSSNETLFFVLGDVSGKGVAAALFMAASQSAMTSGVRRAHRDLHDRQRGEPPAVPAESDGALRDLRARHPRHAERQARLRLRRDTNLPTSSPPTTPGAPSP